MEKHHLRENGIWTLTEEHHRSACILCGWKSTNGESCGCALDLDRGAPLERGVDLNREVPSERGVGMGLDGGAPLECSMDMDGGAPWERGVDGDADMKGEAPLETSGCRCGTTRERCGHGWRSIT